MICKRINIFTVLLLSTMTLALASEPSDLTQGARFTARAIDDSTIEVSWRASSLTGVQEVVLTLSSTSKRKDLQRYIELDATKEMSFSFLNLKSNTTYYIFMDFLENNQYDSLRRPGVPVTTPERRRRTTTTTPTPKTTITRSSTSPSAIIGSLGSMVASRQRKTLGMWVGIAVGGGFALIVILSAFTVLFHRPWRQKGKVSVTMRDKSKSSKRRRNREEKEKKSEAKADQCGATGEEQEVESRYITVSQVTSGVIHQPPNINGVNSWGSEFDVLDGPADNIYSNTNPVRPSEHELQNKPAPPPVPPLPHSYSLPSSPTSPAPHIPEVPPPQTSILGTLKLELANRYKLGQKDTATNEVNANSGGSNYVNADTVGFHSSGNRLANRKTVGRSRSCSDFDAARYTRNSNKTRAYGSVRSQKSNFHNININKPMPLNRGQFDQVEEADDLYVNC